MSFKPYKPGQVIAPTGNWICACGIGHTPTEVVCVSCFKVREGFTVAEGQLPPAPKRGAYVWPFVSMQHRSLFRRVQATGALALVE